MTSGNGNPLDGITSRLAAPLAARNVGQDLGRRDEPERDGRADGAFAHGAPMLDRIGGHHFVPAPGQAPQHRIGLRSVGGFPQDLAIQNDGGIGGQDRDVALFSCASMRFSLATRRT
jgi:hypothetical protein